MTTNKEMGQEKNRAYPYKGIAVSGFLMLFIQLVLAIAVFSMFSGNPSEVTGVIGGIVLVAEVIMLAGYFQLEPNQVKVMIFFGRYRGTFDRTGFYWVNPFLSKKALSLRICNLDVEPIKVNDRTGNPIMIGMVLVWRVKDTYRATFDLETNSATRAGMHANFANFVTIQSDAALREVAGQYAYDDDGSSSELTLRAGGDEINDLLERKINDRLAMAGLEVVEARLNYLAYAPEIAAVMLRRQQADAIIAAREKIVEGAVSMVKQALESLDRDNIVTLSDDRRASMAANLLVVLCSDDPAQPVIPTT